MSQTVITREQIETDAAGFIEREIKDFVANSPANRLEFLDDYKIFDEPLVGFADGGDALFTEYKEIIGPVHMTPGEALAAASGKSPDELPERLSVISWILPIVRETRRSNSKERTGPSRLWSHTRWYGEKLNEALREHIVKVLTDAGYMATAPQIAPYFETHSNEKGMYSNWSERHVAYVAGLGTFSLSDGFITEKGIAHRCGSVITDLVLPAAERTASTPFSNCLFMFGLQCQLCVRRCPAGAITESGHDKVKCGEYQRGLGYPGSIKNGYDNETSVAGCGLCQTRVPCEDRNPTAKIQSKR